MSKLSDRIRKAGQTEHAPMGFAAAKRAPAMTLLAVVRLSASEAGKAGEAAEKGADAIMIDGADDGKIKSAAAKAQGLIIGAGASGGERKQISALRDAGADFVVLSLESAMAETLLEEKIGFVLNLDREVDDTTLRLLSELSLDALVVPPPNGALTVQQLLGLRRLASLSRTPLLTEAAADVDASRLQALRESGVAGVIVDSSSIGKLGRLRETIAALPARGRKREERVEATLPAAALAAVDDDDDVDD